MTTLQDRLPMDVITERARRVTVKRTAQLVLAAIGTTIGWAIGRFFRVIGLTAGLAWRTGTFFVTAVILGFLDGARIPPSATTPPGPPTGG
jgi:hypothetical protein